MFCSDECQRKYNETKDNTLTHPYRSIKQTSPFEILYSQIAKKDDFCVICGNSNHIKKVARTYKDILQGSCFIFVTLLPVGYVHLVPNDDKSHISITK